MYAKLIVGEVHVLDTQAPLISKAFWMLCLRASRVLFEFCWDEIGLTEDARGGRQK